MQSPAHTDATTQSGFSFYLYYLIDNCVIIMFFLFVQFNAIQAVQMSFKGFLSVVLITIVHSLKAIKKE